MSKLWICMYDIGIVERWMRLREWFWTMVCSQGQTTQFPILFTIVFMIYNYLGGARYCQFYWICAKLCKYSIISNEIFAFFIKILIPNKHLNSNEPAKASVKFYKFKCLVGGWCTGNRQLTFGRKYFWAVNIPFASWDGGWHLIWNNYHQ